MRSKKAKEYLDDICPTVEPYESLTHKIRRDRRTILKRAAPKKLKCVVCESIFSYEPEDIQRFGVTTAYILCPVCDGYNELNVKR